MEVRTNQEGNESRRSRVISKLIGARWEVEDVLAASTGSGILSSKDRNRLGGLLGTIDNIVRRMERCR